MTPFLSRYERFVRVGSTNDVVSQWLDDGVPEVCLAVAREQTAGRGRSGRTWQAPVGRALLLSLGFRPNWLEPDRTWQLAAAASLAMADAATTTWGLDDGVIRLKWPNDLVVEIEGPDIRKLGGVLGESQGLGTDDPRIVVGIGINADWPARDFPPELARSMTSLRELSGDRPLATAAVLDTFVELLEARIDALRNGRFDATIWTDRQVTTGRTIRLDSPEGTETVRALGVDAVTGALVVADPSAPGGRRQVFVGEISRVRLAPTHTRSVTAGV